MLVKLAATKHRISVGVLSTGCSAGVRVGDGVARVGVEILVGDGVVGADVVPSLDM